MRIYSKSYVIEELNNKSIVSDSKYLARKLGYSERWIRSLIKKIESYVGDIKAFIDFLSTKGVEFNGNLQRFYVTSYKNYLVEINYEVATINKKINSINALNRYLVTTGDMDEVVVENATDRVKIAYGSEKQVEVYSDKEVERLVFYIQNEEKVSKRNKVIVLLLLYTGVRVSELCSIKIKEIDNSDRMGYPWYNNGIYLLRLYGTNFL